MQITDEEIRSAASAVRQKLTTALSSAGGGSGAMADGRKFIELAFDCLFIELASEGAPYSRQAVLNAAGRARKRFLTELTLLGSSAAAGAVPLVDGVLVFLFAELGIDA